MKTIKSRIWEAGNWLHDAARELRREGQVEHVSGIGWHDDHTVEFEFSHDGNRFLVIVEHIGTEEA